MGTLLIIVGQEGGQINTPPKMMESPQHSTAHDEFERRRRRSSTQGLGGGSRSTMLKKPLDNT